MTAPGHMPLKSNTLAKYPNPVFVETGSFAGDGIQAALDAGFEQVHSIELSERWAAHCRERFTEERKICKVFIHECDSAHMALKHQDTQITFWLDAHEVRGYESAKGPCPLLRELEQIAQHPNKRHTILIDDVTMFPEFGTSLEEVTAALLRINPEYRITRIDGWFPPTKSVMPGEILVAVPPLRVAFAMVNFSCDGSYCWPKVTVPRFRRYFPDETLIIVDQNDKPNRREFANETVLTNNTGASPYGPETLTSLEKWTYAAHVENGRTHGDGMDLAAKWCKENGYDVVIFWEPDCVIRGREWAENLLAPIEQGRAWMTGTFKWFGIIHPCPSAWRLDKVNHSFRRCSKMQDVQHPRYRELIDTGKLVQEIREFGNWMPEHMNWFLLYNWDAAGKNWFECAVQDKAVNVGKQESIHHFWGSSQPNQENRMRVFFVKHRDLMHDKELVLPYDLHCVGPGTRKEQDETGKNLAKRAVEEGKLKPDGKILDFGCGIGRMALPLTEYLTKGKYVGIDCAKGAIDWLQKNITPQFPRFTFHHLDAYNSHYNPRGEFSLPPLFEDGTFDLAFLASVFTHTTLEQVEHYTKELALVIRPGGRCWVSFFLLNDESKGWLEKRAKGENPGPSWLTFPHHDGLSWYNNAADPCFVIAHDEQKILELFAGYGLELQRKVYGKWCGRKSEEGQDVLIFERQ